MNLDATADGDEAEHRVAIDGLTTARQLIIDTFQIAVNDQHVVGNGGVARQTALVQYEVGGTLGDVVARNGLVTLLQLHISVDNVVDIQLSGSDMTVEVADLLEAQLADKHLHHTIVHLDLAVLELALQRLLGKKTLLDLRLLQGKPNLRLGS